jgi:hypothetical protein
MQPIRHIVDDMPELYPVPPDIQHRRVEIIFWPLDDTSPAASFKQWLGSMPDVGEDADFARPLDMGRKDEPWAF